MKNKGFNIDLDYNIASISSTYQRKSISILLGAGFSVPMGYPMGKEVNENLLNFHLKPIVISNDGKLATYDGEKPKLLSNLHQQRFDICNRLIALYNKQNNEFDYEDFFDFIRSDGAMDKFYKEGCNDLVKSNFGEDYQSLLNNLDYIFYQMEDIILHPKDSDIWHRKRKDIDNEKSFYSAFLKAIDSFCKKGIVNVHTLNHDLLFESFQRTGLISETITDGFDDFGSKYFGKLRIAPEDDNIEYERKYRVRLKRYTGRYPSALRLYKLHGSLDQVLFKKTSYNGFLIPDRYIKIQEGIAIDELQKAHGNKMKYEDCIVEYNPNYLTGNTTKLSRYSEKLLYKKLFLKFRKNLQNAEKLIIIGYGCRDKGINKHVIENFDYKAKPCIIIDPKPSSYVTEFAKKLGSTIISKGINEIEYSDLCD